MRPIAEILRSPQVRLLVVSVVLLVVLVTCDRSPRVAPSEQQASVPQASRTALDRLQALAQQGQLRAQIELGNYLYVNENYAEAFTWYQRAAEQGDAGAQSALAYMYAYGLGVPQNLPEAFRWAKNAADRGNAQARQLLEGVLQQSGTSPPSPAQAEE